MDDAKWAQAAARGLPSGAAAAAEGFVRELLEEFYSMYRDASFATARLKKSGIKKPRPW